MANTTFLDLPVAVTLDGTEVVPIVQPPNATEGVSKRVTVGQIADLAGLYNYQLAAESVWGNTSSAIAPGTSIIGSASTVFRYDSSGQIGFGTVDLSTSAAVSGILPVEFGGIGTSALDSGTVLLGNGTSAIEPLPNGTAGFVLTSTGTSTAPAWVVSGGLLPQAPLTVLGVEGDATATPAAIGSGLANQVLRVDPSGTALVFGQVNLSSTAAITGYLAVTAFLTGIVTVPLGGTGTSELAAYGLVAGNGTASVQIVPAGTGGQALVAQGTAALPAYVSITGDLILGAAGTATIVTAAVTYPKIQEFVPLSVLANSSSATAISTAVAGTEGQVLRVATGGTSLGFGQLDLATSAAVTGVLPVPNGGIGTSTLASGTVLLGNGTAALTPVANATAGYILTSTGTSSAPTWQASGAGGLTPQPGLTVLGVAGTSTAVPDAIAGTTDQVLRVGSDGTSLAFGQVNLSSTSAVTGYLSTAYFSGIVSVPFGGTGTSTLTAFGLVAGNGTSEVAIVPAGLSGTLLISQGTAANPQFVASTGDVTYSSVGTATIATAAVTYLKFQNVTALSVVANSSSATTIASAVSGTASQVLRINDGGTALGFGQINLSATGAVTGVVALTNGGTAATSQPNAIVNLKGIALNTTGQAFTGGIALTSLSLGTAAGATTTLVAGNPPLQRIIINGTASFVAPSSECEIDILVTNAGSAGSISFSGYSVGSNTGDTYVTTSGYKFLLQSRTVNGSSTYAWKAFQ